MPNGAARLISAGYPRETLQRLRKNGRWWRSLTAMPSRNCLASAITLSLYCAPADGRSKPFSDMYFGGGKTAYYCADPADPASVGDDYRYWLARCWLRGRVRG
ncbi:hypothetical protein KCP73_11875 [Salmonella enterica subsp. enterica]|nr:hypothetical protein KCP73_11875 [Salmonella enterica subsp. enterica]